jgi:hypothetical protein
MALEVAVLGDNGAATRRIDITTCEYYVDGDILSVPGENM